MRGATENFIEKPNNTLLDLGFEPKTSRVAVALRTTRLTRQSQYIYENIMYVRKNTHLFDKISDRHNFNTRNKHKIAQPFFKVSKVHTSFMGYCVNCYNKIPCEILKLIETKFKKYIKSTFCKSILQIRGLCLR